MKKLIIIIGCAFAAQITYAGDGRYRIERSGATYTKTDTATGDFWILSVINHQWIKPEDIPVPAPTPVTPLEDYEKAKAALPAGFVIDPPNADGTITATKVH